MSRKLTLGPADEESIWNFRGVRKSRSGNANTKKKSKVKKSPEKRSSNTRVQQLVFHRPEPLINVSSDDEETNATATTSPSSKRFKIPLSVDMKDEPDGAKINESDVIPDTPPPSTSGSTVEMSASGDVGSAASNIFSQISHPDSHPGTSEEMTSTDKQASSDSGERTCHRMPSKSSDCSEMVSSVEDFVVSENEEDDDDNNLSENDESSDAAPVTSSYQDSVSDQPSSETDVRLRMDIKTEDIQSNNSLSSIGIKPLTQPSTSSDSSDKSECSSGYPFGKNVKMRQTSLQSFLGLPEKPVGKRQASLMSYFSSPSKKTERFADEKTDNPRNKSRGTTSFEKRAKNAEPAKTSAGNAPKRRCPFYKWISGTDFTVDAFRFGTIPGCSSYFLTHFHADHYGGLTRHFKHPIYCSRVTGNLVIQKLRVDASQVRRLEWNEPTQIGNTKVTLVDANHCPGAAMLLFELPSGQLHLHTGDFRASDHLCQDAVKWRGLIDELYLDTTYCKPEYAFPAQNEAIDAVKSLVVKEMSENENTLVVCGTYSIGKERIFMAIAEALQCSVFVRSDKHRILQCLDDQRLSSLITTEASKTHLHVVPMAELRIDRLQTYCSKQRRKYECVLAIQPTGWTHDSKGGGHSHNPVRLVQQRHNCKIYGVSYSEHSSFTELKHFVQTVRPRRILPTVNNGSPSSREQMNNIFRQWLEET